jgi:hypothetical protein
VPFLFLKLQLLSGVQNENNFFDKFENNFWNPLAYSDGWGTSFKVSEVSYSDGYESLNSLFSEQHMPYVYKN